MFCIVMGVVISSLGAAAKPVADFFIAFDAVITRMVTVYMWSVHQNWMDNLLFFLKRRIKWRKKLQQVLRSPLSPIKVKKCLGSVSPREHASLPCDSSLKWLKNFSFHEKFNKVNNQWIKNLAFRTTQFFQLFGNILFMRTVMER